MSPEEQALRQRLRLNPADADAWIGLGMLAHGQGQDGIALNCFERAIAARPDHADAVLKAAAFQIMAGRNRDALELLTGFLRHHAGTPVHYFNQGLAAQALGEAPLALAAFQQAVARHPAYGEAHSQIAAIYLEQGHLSLARQHLDEAVRLLPGHPVLAFNRAHLLMRAGEMDQALAALDAILTVDPDNHRVRFMRGICLLTKGSLAQGWEGYEARLMFGEGAEIPFLQRPWWDPHDPVKRPVILRNRQGVGDQLLFLAMIRQAQKSGRFGHLIFACDPRTVALMRRSLPDIDIVADDGSLAASSAAEASHQFLLASLPAIFVRKPEDVPDGAGQLVPDPVRVAHWRQWVRSLNRPAVGLSWRGGSFALDRLGHYMGVGDLQPLLARRDVAMINLQYGLDPQETDEAGGRLVHPPGLDLKDDFDGVAALCAAIGGVVAADNTLASLAAGAGTPVLRFAGARPWTMLGGDHYPWFSNTTMIWKDHLEDPWNQVVAAANRFISQRLAAGAGT